MSNDAIDRPARIYDERTFSYPWQEPLALKLIYDELNEAELPAPFARNVLLYYFAVTQLVAMRGNGCPLRKKDIERWAFLNHHAHTQCRQFLVDLRLIRVEERAEEGARKTLFVYILRAPLAEGSHSPDPVGPLAQVDPTEGSHSPRTEPAAEANLPAAEGAAEGSHSPLRSVEELQLPTEVLRTSGDAVASTTEKTTEPPAAEPAPYLPSPGVVDEQQPEGARRRGVLADWTREMIREHHRKSPDAPPEGATRVQALMCALSTTPGSQDVFTDPATFSRACGRVAGALSRKYRSEFVMAYSDWMTAALELDAVPLPKGKEPSFEYWLAALAGASIRDTTASYESKHAEAKANGGTNELSDDEIAAIFESVKKGGGE